MVMLTLGTGVGGGLILDGKPYRGCSRRGRRARPHGARVRRRAVRRHLHGARPLRAVRLGRAPPTGRPRELLGADATGARARRRSAGGERARRWRRCARSAAGSAPASARSSTSSTPRSIVIGGGFSQALDLLLEPALRGRCASGSAAAGTGLPSRVVPAALGPDAGLSERGSSGSRRWTACSSVCATPIGNLEDVTLRVLRELAEADLVLCEDTRRTRILLERHGIEAQPLSYHEHNEAERTAQVLPRLEAGERIALTSDAGLPGRERSGRAADRSGAGGGRAGDRAARAFGGRDGARRERARRRALPVRRVPAAGRAARGRRSGSELARWPHSAVAFESPRRLPASLRSLAAALPERPVAVCRELTKRFEEVARGTAAEIAGRFPEPPRGEITVVVGPGELERAAEADALAAVAELVAGRRRPADGRRSRRAPDRALAQPPLPRLAVT